MEFETQCETIFSEPEPGLTAPEPEIPFGLQPRCQADLSSQLQKPGAGRRDREVGFGVRVRARCIVPAPLLGRFVCRSVSEGEKIAPTRSNTMNTQTETLLPCERLDAYHLAVEFHRNIVPLARARGLASLRDQLLRAAESVVLQPGETRLVATGFSMSLPIGYEAQIRPRSGLAANHQITILNAPGTIDADFRGEVKVILTNLGRHSFEVSHGDRIAQMVIAKVERPIIRIVESLDETARGSGGFGSTGKN